MFAKDVLFPYCIDDRHAPDTLFVLAESDWRMYQKDMLGSAEEVVQHLSQDVHDAISAFHEATGFPVDDSGMQGFAREEASSTYPGAPSRNVHLFLVEVPSVRQ